MAYALPRLNGLRAFEAVARNRSFKVAAAELRVTPGAISQQVRSLEEELKLALFRRWNRAIDLTEAGAALLPVVSDALQRIADTIDSVHCRKEAGPLIVTAPPGFGAKWLVPRLGRFRAAHPDVDVRLTVSRRLADFEREHVDVGIRYGPGRYPGLRSYRLLMMRFFPVCSPSLRESPHPLHEPSDLRYHTLLHSESSQQWSRWLRLHKVQGVDSSRGPVFDDLAMVVRAASEGQGVGMGPDALVEDELVDGRLIKPFDLSMRDRFEYFLVCREEAARRPRIVAFRNWLLAEARKSRKRGNELPTTPGP